MDLGTDRKWAIKLEKLHFKKALSWDPQYRHLREEISRELGVLGGHESLNGTDMLSLCVTLGVLSGHRKEVTSYRSDRGVAKVEANVHVKDLDTDTWNLLLSLVFAETGELDDWDSTRRILQEYAAAGLEQLANVYNNPNLDLVDWVVTRLQEMESKGRDL